MKKKILLTTIRILGVAAIMIVLAQFTRESTVEVIYIYDGDTFIAMVDGKKECIRLARINTPEMSGANTDLAIEARDYLSEWITGKEITLKGDDRDMYNRLLCEIYVDSVNINDKLLDLGLAKVWEPGQKW